MLQQLQQQQQQQQQQHEIWLASPWQVKQRQEAQLTLGSMGFPMELFGPDFSWSCRVTSFPSSFRMSVLVVWAVRTMPSVRNMPWRQITQGSDFWTISEVICHFRLGSEGVSQGSMGALRLLECYGRIVGIARLCLTCSYLASMR